MQDSNANENTGNLQLFADIAEWEEIFENPNGTPQQMPVNQMLPEINLRADQLQPQDQHQYLQSFSSCAFSASSQIHSTIQNQIYLLNQPPLYTAANQLRTQHLQQQLQQNNLPSIQPYVFSPPSQCPSTIQYQSNLRRSSMSHKPINPQLRSNQASFSTPKGVLSSADTVAASPAAKDQYREHMHDRLYPQQLRTQAPPDPVPLSLPHSSIPRKAKLPLTLNYRSSDAETPSSNENFLDRLDNADPEQKEKLTEMRDLINLLKKSRIELGLSHFNLSLEMSKRSETSITKIDIQSLENFTMNLERMGKFKPLMQHWLEETGWLAKEPSRTISYSSTKPANSSSSSQEKQAISSTTTSQVLQNDIQQHSKHGAEDIAMLDKSLTTDKEHVTSSSKKRSPKEENLIHNPAVSSIPHYPSVPTPATILDVYQLPHDRPSQPTPTDYTTHLLPYW